MKLKINSGFTLIEVLVAMTIFSVAILGLAMGTTSAIRANQINLYMTTATNLAQDKLEELKGQPAAGLANGTDNKSVTGVLATFTRSWSVNLGGSNNCPSVADFKCITVTVSWTDYKLRNVTISSAVKA